MGSLLASLGRPNRLQVGLVLLVTVSGVLAAFNAGASPLAAAVVGAGSLVVGVVLTAYLTWIAPDRDTPPRRW